MTEEVLQEHIDSCNGDLVRGIQSYLRERVAIKKARKSEASKKNNTSKSEIRLLAAILGESIEKLEREENTAVLAGTKAGSEV